MNRENWVSFLPFYLLVVILSLGLIYGGSKAVTTMASSAPIERNHCFILDAGHGGIDGGATSCTGVLESTINLEITMRLNDMMHLLGYKTVMIRTTDTSIYTSGNTIAAQKVSDLKERVRIVNEQAGGILLSIHQNTFSDSRYTGSQVFYSSATRDKKMAEILQNNFNHILDSGTKRGAKKGEGIYLLGHIQNPGLLVECGFLSNPKEEALLTDANYQKKLCAIIAATSTEFLTIDK